MSRSVGLVAVCWLGCASAAQADGKLDRARDEMREGSDDDDERHRRDDDDDDDDGNWVGDLIGGFVNALFASGGDDDGDDDEGTTVAGGDLQPQPQPEFGYSRYPYERQEAAYVVTIDRQLAYASVSPHYDVEPIVMPAYAQPFAGQIAIEGGHWDGVTRSGFSARLLTDTRFELDVRSHWLHEPASDAADALLGDAHVAFRFAQTDALLLRMGLGLRFWSDREVTDFGLDALLGLDLFPVRPFVVSAQLGAGHLGQAPVGNARLQFGVAFRRFEVLAGVEWLQIGDVDLSSPVLGLRLWL